MYYIFFQEKMIEDFKVHKLASKHKAFKWPYLQCPCVKNPNSSKNPDISKIEQQTKNLADGHQVYAP